MLIGIMIAVLIMSSKRLTLFHIKEVGIAGLKITAGQQAMSGQDDHLPGYNFWFAVIFTRHVNKQPEKKVFTPLHFKRTSVFFNL